MKGPFRLGFLALLAVALSGCKMAELAPIEGKVYFQVTAGPAQGESVIEPTIGLLMDDEKIYPCLNYSIRAGIGQVGPTITVRLSGIETPGICLTALGLARFARALELAEGA